MWSNRYTTFVLFVFICVLIIGGMGGLLYIQIMAFGIKAGTVIWLTIVFLLLMTNLYVQD